MQWGIEGHQYSSGNNCVQNPLEVQLYGCTSAIWTVSVIGHANRLNPSVRLQWFALQRFARLFLVFLMLRQRATMFLDTYSYEHSFEAFHHLMEVKLPQKGFPPAVMFGSQVTISRSSQPLKSIGGVFRGRENYISNCIFVLARKCRLLLLNVYKYISYDKFCTKMPEFGMDNHWHFLTKQQN